MRRNGALYDIMITYLNNLLLMKQLVQFPEFLLTDFINKDVK